MKKKHLFFAAVLCVALAFGFSACENPNEDELLNRIEKLENQLKDQQSGKDKNDNSSSNEQNSGNSEGGSGDEGSFSTSVSGTENGYDYVDLGLPSGLKWATCNVGAPTPEGYGNYYAWGETTTKSTYYSSTYTYSSNPTTLPLNKDAAAVNMGGSWRMPTKEEWGELMDECSWFWKYGYNGKVSGYLVKSKHNGNSIFLPAAGYRGSSDLDNAGSYGYYWSSSLHSGHSGSAYNLNFDSGDVSWSGYGRYCGQSVRGVCP